MKRRALLLDRDGTIIVDVGYPRDPDAVSLLPGAAEALREASSRGWALVVVSNQSGVARGLVTPDEAGRVQERVAAQLAAAGVRLDGAYFCFHGPDAGCRCRKPEPGMLEAAAADLGLELGASVMVGDKPSDVEAGRRAGCATVAFGDNPTEDATARCAGWPEVAAWLRTRN